MKGAFFNKPLEWNVETEGESWQQGSSIKGVLKVKNHGPAPIGLDHAGVAIAYADIKKVHAKTDGILKPQVHQEFPQTQIAPGETLELAFNLLLPENSSVTEKRASYFLTYGQNLIENHLMLKVEPKALFNKIIGLMDTFCRFKLKEYKSSKTGVEFKLIPPTSREMVNIEGLNLTFEMKGQMLFLTFDFQIKKLDSAAVTTKIIKESVKIKKELSPKEYSLGQEMINQDKLLKVLEEVMTEVKMKNSF